jgi:hypothetical protein
VNQYFRSHPNQTFILRVQRGKKVARLKITPEPFVPEEKK